MDNFYDVIIIGRGPAGLTSAVYTARSRLNTLVLGRQDLPSQLSLTDVVENYPGFPQGIKAYQLLERLENQAEKFGAQLKYEKVEKIERKEDKWQIIGRNQRYQTISLIVATGTKPKKLGVKGEEEFLGKGISYCAVCDAPFFKDKNVVVIGGGNTAIEEALYLAKFAKKITLVHRRQMLRATKILQERIFSHNKIEIEWNSLLKEIKGEDKVKSVKLWNIKEEQEKEIFCQGVFIFVGNTPNTEFLKGVVELNQERFVVVDKDMATSQQGIFACGDCTDVSLKQVATAIGTASLAGVKAKDYVENYKGIAYK